MFDCRLFGVSPTMFFSSKYTAPVSGVSKPAIIRSNVVLPQPEGPSSEKNSPFCICRFAFSSARNEPNDLETFSMEIPHPFILFPSSSNMWTKPDFALFDGLCQYKMIKCGKKQCLLICIFWDILAVCPCVTDNFIKGRTLWLFQTILWEILFYA